MPTTPKTHRFLTMDQVAEELNVRDVQIRSLLKTGGLKGIQVGGRGLWRIGIQDVEDFIAEAYRNTAERIASGDRKANEARGCRLRRLTPSYEGLPS